MKTFNDWLKHLENLHPKGQDGIELGLERMVRVKDTLQQTQTLPLLVVGGTNGKGSTCAYLEAIYSAAGYRVGCYSSPHLLAYNERVRVNREPTSDAVLSLAFAKVETARQATGVALTYFEFGTLAAWEVFAASALDVLILEVGLGGRLDAVNAYDADCAVVTGIALDHTDWLGHTREAIGFEKAGIYRAGRPALCADPLPPNSLLEYARTLGADLQLLGREFGFETERVNEILRWNCWGKPNWRLNDLPSPGLTGRWQIQNAAAALAAVQTLLPVLPLPERVLREALTNVHLPGRFQILAERPRIVVDVAHNPQAVAGLANTLDATNNCAQTFALVGMLRDKDIAGALKFLAGKIDHWLLADLDVPRGASAQFLAEVIETEKLGGSCACFSSPEAALASAVKQAGENDRIVAFGSFYTVAAILRTMPPNA